MSEETSTTEVTETTTTESTSSWWKTAITTVLKSKVFWTASVGVGSVAACKIFGHSVDADTQTGIVDAIMTLINGAQ